MFIAAIVAESLAAAQDPAPDHPTAPILESAGAPPLADVAWLCDGRMYGSKGEHASWDVLVSSRDWTDLRDVLAAKLGPPSQPKHEPEGALWGTSPSLTLVPYVGRMPFPTCDTPPPEGIHSVIVVLKKWAALPEAVR